MEIRAYDPERDRDAVRACFESGFGRTMWPIVKYSEPRAIDDMIEVDVKSCNVSLVADIDGIARGVLLGSTRTGPGSELRTLPYLFAFIYRRWVTDRPAMRPFARAALRRTLIGEIPYYIHSPRGESAEIYDLTTMEGYRGGLGRALVDAFVEEARRAGLNRVDVGTDTELAWGFYERYGFQRVREFPLHIYDYSLPDRDVTGYIYSLTI